MRAPTGAAGHDGAAGTLLFGALLASTVVVMPTIMLGALAVLVRGELRFGETQLGLAAGLFAVSATAVSAPGGRLAERIGAARTMTVGALITGAALVAIAVLAGSWMTLAACLLVAGIGNGLTQPATNGVLSAAIAPHRQGLAFGFKQAAIPLAGVLSGLALPLIALRVGWRWAFAAGGLLALGVVLVVPRARAALRLRQAQTPPAPADGEDSVPLRPLLIITFAACMGSAASNVIGAFFVESTVASGVPEANAGYWLIGAAGSGIVARMLWGWIADRRDGRHLPFVAWLMVIGAVGLGILALQPAGGPGLLVGAVLAYGAAWGWPGLFNYAIVRQSRAAPAAATGVTQSGVFAGLVVGPPTFGWLVETLSYRVAWSVFALLLLLAAALLLVGRAQLLRARGRPRATRRAWPVPLRRRGSGAGAATAGRDRQHRWRAARRRSTGRAPRSGGPR